MKCYYCEREYTTENQLRWHNHLTEPYVEPQFAPFYPVRMFRGHGGIVKCIEYVRKLGFNDIDEIVDIYRLVDTTKQYLQGMFDHHGYRNRFNVHFLVDFFKPNPDDTLEIVQAHLTSSSRMPNNKEELDEDYFQIGRAHV